MSLNSSTSWPEGPLVLLWCRVNRLIDFLRSVARLNAIAMGKGCLWVPTSLVQVLLCRGFPSFYLDKQTGGALLWSWVKEDFTYPWDPSLQEILPSFRTLID